MQAKNPSQLFNANNINPLCTISSTFVGKVNTLIPYVTYSGQKEARYQGYVEKVINGVGRIFPTNFYERQKATYTGNVATYNAYTKAGQALSLTQANGTVYNYTGTILSEYLVPSIGIREADNASFHFKDFAAFDDENASLDVLQKLGTVRLATKDYGSVVVLTGALVMGDGTVYRIQPVGYLKQVTVAVVESEEGYQINVYEPSTGISLYNLKNMEIEVAIEDELIALTYNAEKGAYCSGIYSSKPSIQYISISDGEREIFRQGASLAA